MARGDVITDSHVTVAQNSSVTVQPASGDEWLITWMSQGPSGGVRFEGYDGTNIANRQQWAPTGGNTAVQDRINLGLQNYGIKLFFTNSEYFRLNEENTAVAEAVYCGVKTKE